MNIQELLKNLNIKVGGLSLNTQTLKPGDVFFAIKGHKSDGRTYLLDAIQKGACALVVEAEGSELFPLVQDSPIPVISIKDLHMKLSEIAGQYYGNPSHDLQIIGITGTNGKTTCAHLLASSMTKMGVPCAMMGTLTNALTTPDAITIQSQLAAFKAKGIKAVAMEVSSHGLDQYRVQGVRFESAIFTNLSQDHLDYHESMAHYGAAKQKLFAFKSLKRMILNADDPFTQIILEGRKNYPAILYTREKNILVDFKKNYPSTIASNILLDNKGIIAKVKTAWGEGKLHSKLLGDFNLSNLLGVLSELCARGFPLTKVLETIGDLSAPPGRMQQFNCAAGVTILVDYSHTPDSLYNALKTIRQYCKGKLWCVFGCGGDRDKLKRPQMGYIAATMADRVIVTSDNPRCEAMEDIIKDILDGIPASCKTELRVDANRETAIQYAVHSALDQDVVLIAGKGHEAYQIIGDHCLTFSDSECVQMCINQRALN